MKSCKAVIPFAFTAIIATQTASLPAPPAAAGARTQASQAEHGFLKRVDGFLSANPGERPKYDPLIKSFKQWTEQTGKNEGCFVSTATLARGENETSELTLTMAIQNGTAEAIAKYEVECVVYTPARTIPWAVNRVTITVSGGIEPGELKRQTVRLDTADQRWRDAFSALAQEENLRLDCYVTRAFDKDDSLIGFFNPTSEDHQLLRQIEQKIGYEGDAPANPPRNNVRFSNQSMVARFSVGG
ncbi:hypothetical protein IT570_06990 [Candidatus Sumerlaeota bacterium]|nr:hypothetical protein [Candidatus Sumerlaeota bacterium]